MAVGIEVGDFVFKLDEIGNLVFKLKSWDFWISALPLTKWHLEELLILAPKDLGFTDNWYREILKLNPRVSYRDLEKLSTEPWGFFATGLYSSEAEKLLKLLEGRLPTREQWESLFSISPRLREISGKLEEILAEVLEGELILSFYQAVLKRGLFPLVEEGFLEYVYEDGAIKLIGKPFYDLYPNLWNPLSLREVDTSSPLMRRMISFRYVFSL